VNGLRLVHLCWSRSAASRRAWDAGT
jgi:hypothetical protein